MFLPWRGAGQRLTSGTVGDIRCDYREDEPGGQEPPPVKFGSKVERNDPHLEQSHQLEDSRAAVLAEVRRQRDSYTVHVSYVVGLRMSLLPLHQDELSDYEGDDEDEHHLCVHRLMAFMLGVHSRMLHPVEENNNF